MRERSAIAGNSCDSWLQMCWNRSEGWWWYWCVDVENNNQNEWKGRWFSTDNSTYYQIKWHQHTHHEGRNNKRTGERGDVLTLILKLYERMFARTDARSRAHSFVCFQNTFQYASYGICLSIMCMQMPRKGTQMFITVNVPKHCALVVHSIVVNERRVTEALL